MTHLSGWVLLAAVQSVMPDPITLRGTIVAAGTGAALPFSIVQLGPVGGQRFTDQNGAFAFINLAPGTYRLRVRQIGYRPRDTTLTLEPGIPALRIGMLRIAFRLDAITVTGRTTCVRPGAPDPVLNPELAVVFDQLLENARRYTLLADSYPHRYQNHRRFTSLPRDRRDEEARSDTTLHESWTRWVYAPGNVVGPPDHRNGRSVRLVTLPDFADSAFVNHHCFWLVGRDTLEGNRYIRVDFAPIVSLETPDVAGAAFLDPLTYQLTFTSVRLTRPERALRNMKSLEATSHFREVYPGIPLLDRVRAVQEVGPGRPTAGWIEEQNLLRVDFLRPLVTPP